MKKILLLISLFLITVACSSPTEPEYIKLPQQEELIVKFPGGSYDRINYLTSTFNAECSLLQREMGFTYINNSLSVIQVKETWLCNWEIFILK